MAAQDITRLLDPRPNRYVGSRLQQGRALVDSDFNEARRADDQELQLSTRQIVGRKASPDDGFLPELEPGQSVKSQLIKFGSFSQAFVLNYNLRPGTMYVGGWRFVQADTEPIAFQREYLQIGPATAPRAAVGTQRQLSYLRAWEQPVTAVEDSELIEPALHGADGAVRVRRMRRVEVRNVDSADCATAFDEVLEELGDGTSATYDPATCELRSNARLRLGFFGEAAGDCEGCEPALRGKYLASEDHTIKIMLATPDSFVWAFDNGAPLYRVKLILDGDGGARVEMLTPPKDTFHEPVLDTVVEFLPWSTLLENGRPGGGKASGESVGNEKLSSRVGFFAEVDAPYETGARSFHVKLDPNSLSQIGFSIGKGDAKSLKKAQIGVKTGESPAADVIALEWDPGHPHASELNAGDPASSEELISYVYLRVWHVKKSDEPLTILTSSNKPLGRTGLVPTFGGSGRRGDCWRATLRTGARDEILPRELMRAGGRPPDGPREVVAPLALVEWDSPFGVSHRVVSIRDCRPSQPAMTNRGCCTYTVGTATSGHFHSIQAAVDALPPAGGRICLLPGTYREEVRAAGRDNVTVVGCGARTVIESPAEPAAEALLTLDGQSSLIVESVHIRAAGQIAVLATGRGVELRSLDIRVEAANAIRALDVERLRIVDNSIRMGDPFSHHAAVYLHVAADALVEGNRIEALGDLAWGGVQLAGGSRRVELRDNQISGGRGHGITLGSVRFRATDGSELGIEGAGEGQSAAEKPFTLNGRLETVERPGRDGPQLYYPDPEPAIEDLVIADNRIRDCRGSGISALALEVIHGEVASGPPLCIRRTTFAVERLEIRDNLIEANARGGPGELGEDRTRGGIVLSEVRDLSLVRNRIDSNGAAPDSGPICGVYLGHGQDVAISHNRVVNNGRAVEARAPAAQLRGGIVLTRPLVPESTEVLTQDPSITGVQLRGNVVENPEGPALTMIAGGHCSVTANYLDSRSHAVPTAPTGALTVTIFQPGRPWEAVDLPPNEPDPIRWTQPAGSQDYLGKRAQDVDTSGGLIFADNQISTLGGTKQQPSNAIPVMIAATDSVVMTGNQLGAELPRGSIFAHCVVIGSTVNISRNRVAEGIETTNISLIAMAPMLTLADDNLLTHCPAVFGCANHNNDAFFVDEGNLHWFRLQSTRCEAQLGRIRETLQALCAALFGLGEQKGAGIRRLRRIPAFRRFQR